MKKLWLIFYFMSVRFVQASSLMEESWQWHKPASDLRFLSDSHAWLNEPYDDRPANPMWGEYSNFKSLAGDHLSFLFKLQDYQ